MAKANADQGPKRKDDDCDMVTSLQASELSKNELCLHEAARKNDEALLRKIIRRNAANINCKNNLDRTALHMAASQGNVEAAKILINEGKALVDLADKYGMTPFLWAAYFGHLEVLVFLVEKGANISKRNKQGCDVMHIASENNWITILEHMFRKHKHIKIDESDNNGMTPFLLAVSKNSYESAKALTERDCDLLAKDKNNRNACHLAAINGHDQLITLLIDLQVAEEVLNAKDSSFHTPLMYAAENGHKLASEVLLSAEAYIEATMENEMTALHLAAQHNHGEIVEVLLDKGANINSQNIQGNTPLHIATFINSAVMVTLLLSREADMDIMNKRDQTPLHSGVEQNKCDSVEVLLLKGAHLEGIDKTGKTPLLMAARGSYIAMVDMIIKADRRNQKKMEISELQREGASSVLDNGDLGPDSFRPADYDNVYNIHLEESIKTVLDDSSYSLKEFNQPYAEEFKLYLWKIAFNHLRFGEWKKLAQYWGFKPEHILAIEYQQVQSNSYKYHGYRVLCIWFHGVESHETPIRGLYEALVSIGRRKLADKIRRELDVNTSKGGLTSACIIS